VQNQYQERNSDAGHEKLCKVYRTHLVETHALRGLDMEVKEGEFVTVTGPSGSGKTTFLNIAGLLEDFSSGQYLLDGAGAGPE
jgi:putative ABC transport system ATP-binding protein